MNKSLYYENLDGLRFFSFLSVFFYHNFVWNFPPLNKNLYYAFIRDHVVTNGNLGVNFFFVLSGFLITTLLIAEKKLNGNLNIPFFWLRRVFRIWPLFYICVFIGFIIYPLLRHFSGQPPEVETARPFFYFTFLNNLDILNRGWPHSATLSILWSVAVEEQFYLVWPVVLFFIPVKRMWIPFVIVVIISLVFRAYHTYTLVRHYHTLSCIGDLAIGALGAWLIAISTKFKKIVTNLSRTVIVMLYMLVVIIYIYSGKYENVAFVSLFERIVIAILFLFIILEQTFSKNSFYKMSNLKRISKLGTITYGLYCLHLLAILFVTTLVNKLHFNKYLWQIIIIETPLALLLAIIFSSLSFRFIETPFLKLKNRFAFIKKKAV